MTVAELGGAFIVINTVIQAWELLTERLRNPGIVKETGSELK